MEVYFLLLRKQLKEGSPVILAVRNVHKNRKGIHNCKKKNNFFFQLLLNALSTF